jgi:hypothetical protein
MGMGHDQVWVEIVSNTIIAGMQGDVSEGMLNQRHAQILQMARDTGCRRLLLDDLKMNALSYEILETQRVLNVELDTLGFKIAIVVPNSRLAYLARLKFGGNNYRVFYNDMAEALDWLHQN